jgi:translation initiation factor IF-2
MAAPPRLSKVANEFNVTTDTIVDFLKSKGQNVGADPNIKLSEAQYALVAGEYGEEKKAKEEAIQKHTEKGEFFKEIKRPRFEDKPLLPKPPGSSPPPPKAAPPPSPVPAPAPPITQPEIKAEKPKKEVPEVKTEKPKAGTESTPAPSPTPVVVEPVVPAKTETPRVGPKIIGKIELPPDIKPSKKEKPSRKKPGKGTKSTEGAGLAPDLIPAPPKEAPVVPEPVKPEPVIPEKPKEEFIATKYEKLKGVTEVGRIELPKPVASSASPKRSGNKKRKRIFTKDAVREDITKSAPREPAKKREDRRGGAREHRPEVTEDEIKQQIKETIGKLTGQGKSKAAKYRREKRILNIEKMEQEAIKEAEDSKILKVAEFVSANELAKMMNVPINDVISKCMELGLFVSINQRLDAETIAIVAEEFGHQVEFVSIEAHEAIQEEEDTEDKMVPRPPIVTVMGHVDHGKTSLLDYIRKTNVIAGEAGGITQHIGAYNVTLENGKKITFLDTPGHEAFTAMRARGAQATDIVIIVIAADDGVMPQTTEAINHAQAAGVPMVFAINKIDKPGANPNKIKETLAGMNILVEDWGGKFQCQEISAKSGLGVHDLLEKVLLESDYLELKANPDKKASGVVIESALDKGKGYVATVLVEGGTLRVGNVIVAGACSGKVKAMQNERGLPLGAATPAMPAVILGLDGAPQAGDRFHCVESEQEAREIANKRQQLQREQGLKTRKHITLDEIGRRLAIGDFKELNIIVKGDFDGSIEALSDSLLKLSGTKVQVNIVHKGVGQITESDVLLASASNAVIIGFQVRPSLAARKLAETEQIDVRLYSIIYDAINEVRTAMEGMLSPEMHEKVTCNLEVRNVFNVSKVGTVAGCMVLSGKVSRNTKVRIIRDGIVIHSGELGSLKRFKEDAKDVPSGYECGLNITNFNDINVGDMIEGYEQVEVKAGGSEGEIVEQILFFWYICKMRIYLDTSVIGGVFAKVFSADTKPFFEHVLNKRASIIVSDLLETELLGAPLHIKEFIKTLPASQIEKIALSDEALNLADKYLAEKVVGKTSLIDCQHIAIATICKADVLASWNFKHIVNLERIRGYNSINLRNGYSLLEIRSPKEIFAP